VLWQRKQLNSVSRRSMSHLSDRLKFGFSLSLALSLVLGVMVALTQAQQTQAATPLRPLFATITVNTTADELNTNGNCSLREAITNANNDAATYPDCTAGSGADTINLPAGIYTLTIAGAGEDANATGDLDATDAAGLTMVGAGAASTLINANGLDRALHAVAGPLTLQDLTIQNGNAAGANSGGGVLAASTLNLTGTRFLSNTAGTSGGGMFGSSVVSVMDGWFERNTAGASGAGSGGGLVAIGSLRLSDTTFLSNTAVGALGRGGGVWGIAVTIVGGLFQYNRSIADAGGGLYADSTLSLTGTQFLSNTASLEGGGLYANSTLGMTGTQFLSNTASSNGGGAYAVGAAQVNGGLFQHNVSTSGRGGGLYAVITLDMIGTQFLSNTANNYGGGAFVFGAAQVSGGLFQHNVSTSGRGGGLLAESMLALTGTTFFSNTASLEGGGAYAVGAAQVNGGLFQHNVSMSGSGGGINADQLTLTGTQFLSNTASVDGGGAYAFGAAQVNGGLFRNNVSVSSNGGGLYANSTLTLTGTQFLGNNGAQGGGVYHSAGTGRMVNALFARNAAISTLGAALFLASTGGVQILHTTIASPTVGSGSAIYIAAGTVGITNTIVVSYATGISRTTGTVYENYNLFFGNTVSRTGNFAAGSGANDVTGNPALVNPSANDYHLTATSYAVDRGSNASIATDFENQARPQGLGFDIGYDESPFSAAITGLSINSSIVTPTVGAATTFTATTTGGSPPITYSWSVSGPTTGNGTGNPFSYTFTTPGTYTVTVTATNPITATTQSIVVMVPYRVYLPLIVR
jgi:CSLREA domain-containing protein